MSAKGIVTSEEPEVLPLDLEALSSIDEEIVEIAGQKIILTMLVPADVEKARKLIMSKQLDENLAMEYMTFLAMKKKHPEVTWYRFQKLNFKTVNKLMAVMAVQNGFDETFRTFGERTFSGGEDTGSQSEDTDIGLD